jgi:hypothetical protein
VPQYGGGVQVAAAPASPVARFRNPAPLLLSTGANTADLVLSDYYPKRLLGKATTDLGSSPSAVKFPAARGYGGSYDPKPQFGESQADYSARVNAMRRRLGLGEVQVNPFTGLAGAPRPAYGG